MAGLQQVYIIAYDIASDTRRAKVAKTLEDYGKRANYSVFECGLSKEKADELKQKLVKLINSRKDCILFYPLCRACAARGEYMGKTAGEKNPKLISV